MDVVTVSPATVISSRLISVFRHGAFQGRITQCRQLRVPTNPQAELPRVRSAAA